jgi:hypothetical protein
MRSALAFLPASVKVSANVKITGDICDRPHRSIQRSSYNAKGAGAGIVLNQMVRTRKAVTILKVAADIHGHAEIADSVDFFRSEAEAK